MGGFVTNCLTFAAVGLDTSLLFFTSEVLLDCEARDLLTALLFFRRLDREVTTLGGSESTVSTVLAWSKAISAAGLSLSFVGVDMPCST